MMANEATATQRLVVSHQRARDDLTYVGERKNPLGYKGSEKINVRISCDEIIELWIIPSFESKKPKKCTNFVGLAERSIIDALVKFMNEGRNSDFVGGLSYSDRVSCLRMAEMTGCKDAICLFASAVYELSTNDLVKARRVAVEIDSGTLVNAVDSAICTDFNRLKLSERDLTWSELTTWLDTSNHDRPVEGEKFKNVYFTSERYLWALVCKWLKKNADAPKQSKHALVKLVRPRLFNDPERFRDVCHSLLHLSSVRQMFEEAFEYAKRTFSHHEMNADSTAGVRHRRTQTATFGVSEKTDFLTKHDLNDYVHVRSPFAVAQFYRTVVIRNLAYMVSNEQSAEANGTMRMHRYNPVDGTFVRLANSEVKRYGMTVCLSALDDNTLVLSGGGADEFEVYDLSHGQSGTWKVESTVLTGITDYTAHATCMHGSDLCAWYVDKAGDHRMVVMGRTAATTSRGRRKAQCKWSVQRGHSMKLPEDRKRSGTYRLSVHSLGDSVVAFHGTWVVAVHMPTGTYWRTDTPSHPATGEWVDEVKTTEATIRRIGRDGLVDEVRFESNGPFGIRLKRVDRVGKLSHGPVAACASLLFPEGYVRRTKVDGSVNRVHFANNNNNRSNHRFSLMQRFKHSNAR